MEHSPGNGGVPQMFVVKLDVPQQVMIEKWLLVVLIIGCTSLVFVICFPIDFYLYRRRKRLARERKNTTMFRPQTPTRAAQIHAKVTTTEVAAEIDMEDLNDEEQRRYRAERRIRKYLSVFKKTSLAAQKGALQFQERLTESKFENRANLEAMATPETNEHLERRNELALYAYPKSNEKTTNKVSQSVNEVAVDLTKSDTILNSNDESSQHIPASQLTNVSMAWSENEYLFTHESKHLKYGAREPLENLTNYTNSETIDKHCFTIPVRSGNPVNAEADTRSNERYVEIHDTNKSRTDPPLENETNFFPTETCEDTNGCVPKHDNKVKSDRTDTHPEDVRRDTKLFTKVINASGDKTEKRYKILTHSQSDLCISESFKHSKSSLKGGKKRNMVTPTDSNSFNYSEPSYIYEDSYIPADRTSHYSSPFDELSFPPNVKKTKRKINSHLKKKAHASSMPQMLFSYQKKKY